MSLKFSIKKIVLIINHWFWVFRYQSWQNNENPYNSHHQIPEITIDVDNPNSLSSDNPNVNRILAFIPWGFSNILRMIWQGNRNLKNYDFLNICSLKYVESMCKSGEFIEALMRHDNFFKRCLLSWVLMVFRKKCRKKIEKIVKFGWNFAHVWSFKK